MVAPMRTGTTATTLTRLLGRALGAVVAALAAACVLASAPARAVTIDTSARSVQAARLSMAFSLVGPDVVKALQWADSAGTVGANLVENSGAGTCGKEALPDPANFWGGSYGDVFANDNPKLVLTGASGTWTSPATNQVQTNTEYPVKCSAYTASVPVATTYTYFDAEPQASEIEVQRTWNFGAPGPPASDKGFRAYVPQLPLGKYGEILYPSAGALKQLNASQCLEVACPVEFSNGWFAINDATIGDASLGSGMIVLRDAGDSLPAKVAIESIEIIGAGPPQRSNLSSIDLTIPAGGLIAPLTETEFLCFYDSSSWPQAERNALRLPAGCGPPPSAAGPAAAGGAIPAPSTSTPTNGGPHPALPPPSIRHNFNVQPAGGHLRIRLPGKGSFIPLTEAQQIPLGSIIDATHGTVQLTSAKDANGHTETGLFYAGVFRVTQERARSGVRGGHTVVLTVLTLVGALPSGCGGKTIAVGHGRARTAAAKSGHGTARRLWGNAKGNFRTVGHDASATVRGTKWLTEDTCDGTEVRVARGVVSVDDFPHHRGFLLRAPHGFLSHPGRGG